MRHNTRCADTLDLEDQVTRQRAGGVRYARTREDRIGCFSEGEASLLSSWYPPIPHLNIAKVALLLNSNIANTSAQDFVLS
jgi:hypothetical protein